MQLAVFVHAALLALACATRPSTAPTAAPAAAAHYTGPVVDVHMHVMFADEGALKRLKADPAHLIEEVERSRVAQAGVIVMAARPGIEATRRLNDRLAALVRQHPARLFAIGTVHPGDGEAALQELERIKALGFRMLKLHPITQQLDLGSPEVAAVVRKATELGMPVLFDFSGILNAADLGKYVMLAVTNPEARIVLAHMGGTRFHDMLVLTMLQEYDWYRNNIWVDLSAVSELYARSPYKEQLVYVIRKIGVDRVLFGSDFPFVRTPTEAIDDVESLGLTADEERMIFYENAAALLQLQQRE
ncbi:amidohydrolase family protein [Nannocystis radixulma]|uniref:Amidohydrolase family protein n=1 Tax=Nannocystis radixulma TaxID=2995305 RepID=A0ABT5BA28_9BACT|nr:amidohydrolase family protein [Nannocystis radixulma]MDC0670578.1 amidohydrolase family protein [Nannocystis radixulma]